jgi:murein DD-endopeptidase MepM/ murein hydrolase activator NlpD
MKAGFATIKYQLSPLGTITTRFGDIDKTHSRPHTGIDIAAPEGYELHSPVEGIISKIVDYQDRNIGKGLFIKTEEGYQIILGHLSKFADIKVGDIVHRGDYLGNIGTTGRCFGSHLHLGIKDSSGKFIDPLTIFFDDIRAAVTEIVLVAFI